VAGVARMTEFSRTYLSLVFNGRLPVTDKVRAACAKALGRTADELFHDDTTPVRAA
jgi:transcriptional regulator with XRE-family HTH domain